MKISLQTSLVQVIGVFVCGFAIKKSDNELIFATSMLIYSLLHFLLGLIVYSNPIVSNNVILLHEKSSLVLTKCLYVTLLNVQLLTIHHNSADFWHLRTILIITSATVALFLLAGRHYWKLFLDVFTMTQCALLMYLSMTHDADNFWLHSMSVLILFNYFTIPELARRYCVPKQELLSISLIFQNIFLVNSLY